MEKFIFSFPPKRGQEMSGKVKHELRVQIHELGD